MLVFRLYIQPDSPLHIVPVPLSFLSNPHCREPMGLKFFLRCHPTYVTVPAVLVARRWYLGSVVDGGDDDERFLPRFQRIFDDARDCSVY